IEYLYHEIAEILGLNDGNTIIIIGAGNLGRALAKHSGFEKRGFKLVGIFDNSPDVIGQTINRLTVRSVDELESFIESNRVDIGILTVPKTGVHDIAYRLVNSGVKALLNFSYKELNLPKDIAVENIHLSDPLMTLSYKLKERGEA
ncbi:MAG: redox-sensing transcriptional repressor Rex, partial [Firmicutes bacterium]|nr:redox-sensing transcriptional repressor Rex [Bacillota bacterium]